MHSAPDVNLAILSAAARYLGDLVDDVVFVGGAAAGLLITDPASGPVRVTRDIDVITAVATHLEFHRLAGRLRELGFSEDQSDDAPICRMVRDEVILDVMPTDARVLGFGNPWYPAAFENALLHELPNGQTIRLISAPYFLATKFVAFESRGNADFLASPDLEDIITVIDGRAEIVDDVAGSAADLRRFLSEKIHSMLDSEHFLDALPGHLPGAFDSPGRYPVVMGRLEAIAEGDTEP